VIGMVVVFGAGVLGTLGYMKRARAKHETELADTADQDMKGKNYKDAIRKFDDLMKNYPSSKNQGKYKVLKRHCQAIDSAMNPGDEALKRRNEVLNYLVELRDSGDPNIELARERKGELRDALIRIAEDQVRDIREKSVKANDLKKAAEEYADALKTQGMITEHSPPSIQPAIPVDLVKKFADLNEMIEKADAFKKFVDHLRDRLAAGINPALVTSLRKEAADNG